MTASCPFDGGSLSWPDAAVLIILHDIDQVSVGLSDKANGFEIRQKERFLVRLQFDKRGIHRSRACESLIHNKQFVLQKRRQLSSTHLHGTRTHPWAEKRATRLENLLADEME